MSFILTMTNVYVQVIFLKRLKIIKKINAEKTFSL